jgi:hypothetical protein
MAGERLWRRRAAGPAGAARERLAVSAACDESVHAAPASSGVAVDGGRQGERLAVGDGPGGAGGRADPVALHAIARQGVVLPEQGHDVRGLSVGSS